MSWLIEGAGGAVIVYFVLLNLAYLAFTVLAWRQLAKYRRSRYSSPIDEVFKSPLTPPVSILLPAYNEEAGVVDSVQSLLHLRYAEFEVLVIDDGSTDGTLPALEKEFELVAVRKALQNEIHTAPIRQAYFSRKHHNLWVISKDNGGKADALNAGLNAARYPFVCAVDGDAVLEQDALLRVMMPIIESPLVVATGGIIRIANGCEIDHGRVVNVGLPKSRLATLQVVEYLRAFLVGRVGWSAVGGLLIISGAFGVFKRSAVMDAGGYSVGTVGEDMELVVRLHRHLRSLGKPYEIAFVPDPVCWTEVPEDLATLGRQRRRWQRGLAETLWRHRGMMGNPKMGILGWLATPYYVLFELLGPFVETAGYLIIPIAAVLGVLSVEYLIAFLALSIVWGTLLSISALALEEISFRRHPRSKHVIRLASYALIDNLGYRQLSNFWRLLGLVDFLRKRKDWGVMTRKGLNRSASITREAA
ncbi:MAG TPA: glycosyltransferase [Acidimicrobiia bacterium]|nr:glycosyltransferase [Acidimicrobiia bacterium]